VHTPCLNAGRALRLQQLLYRVQEHRLQFNRAPPDTIGTVPGRLDPIRTVAVEVAQLRTASIHLIVLKTALVPSMMLAVLMAAQQVA